MERHKHRRETLPVEDMTCAGCETRIESTLQKLDGVIDVSANYNHGEVSITYDETRIQRDFILKAIEKCGYHVAQDKHKDTEKLESANDAGVEAPGVPQYNQIASWIGTGVLIVMLYLFINRFQGLGLVPEINQSMGYGILFLVGLFTSLHCVAMCGGINLTVCMQYRSNEGERFGKLIPAALYNLGRVVSYTLAGGLAGAVGSVITLPGRAKGIVAVLSGLFMLIMGMNMIGIFPVLKKFNLRLPKFLGQSVYRNSNRKGPFIVGLLNGLMPCGPLQAMQLYALGTGSFAAGALSMFLFSIGTVPLMFGFGALSSALKGKYTHKIMKAGSVLVIVLGLIMLNRGLNLSGFGMTVNSAAATPSNIAVIQNGVQYVSTDLEPGRYFPVVVQKGLPVKWTIQVEKGDLNGCNNPVTIPQLGLQQKLEVGSNVIEFTPEKEGDLLYTCWMGMISSRIRVVSDITGTTYEDVAIPDSSTFDNVTGFNLVPVDTIAVGEIRDGIQYIELNVNENEYSPAVIVLQENIQTVWKLNCRKMNEHNGQIIFPEYGAGFNLEEGENEIEFVPSFDFGFQCPSGIMVGFVKVVKAIKDIDLNAISEEAGRYRTQPAGSGFSCH